MLCYAVSWVFVLAVKSISDFLTGILFVEGLDSKHPYSSVAFSLVSTPQRLRRGGHVWTPAVHTVMLRGRQAPVSLTYVLYRRKSSQDYCTGESGHFLSQSSVPVKEYLLFLSDSSLSHLEPFQTSEPLNNPGAGNTWALLLISTEEETAGERGTPSLRPGYLWSCSAAPLSLSVFSTRAQGSGLSRLSYWDTEEGWRGLPGGEKDR